MDKETNKNNKQNISNINIIFEKNNINENEILSFSSSGSSNKANPGSSPTFLSDKNAPASSPLSSSIPRSFSVNFPPTETFDFDPLSGSDEDLNSGAVGVANENNNNHNTSDDSDVKNSPKYSSEELSDPNGSNGSDSYENTSPNRDNTEIWEENSENNISPSHSDPFDPLDPQEPLEVGSFEQEDENMKRIRDWIDKIEINNTDIIKEEIETGQSSVISKNKGEQSVIDPKTSVSNVMGYNYISALKPATSSAQLAGLGLVAIPILSAFSSLRELSLSNNNILRITAGALPKGLHVLNLSKNYISAIEGLKDLTRLRVLDLSYNRISRIGHGLASCSSIKELYIAANKISEIEGLHRLLKLKILDLRSNKISTAKGLEQLAANYSSLEAISLDGNPAQRNVRDEHLKRYLLTLLPRLVYYNKHSVKSRGGSSKDRIGSGNKGSRKIVGNSGNGKARDRNVNLVRVRGRNVNLLPPSSPSVGLRLSENPGKRVSGLNPLRRVQSEGAMGF